MFVNSAMLAGATGFRRGEFGILDVHTPLHGLFTLASTGPDVWRHRKPWAMIPDNLYKDERTAWEEKLNRCMVERLTRAHNKLDGSLRRGDTDSFW